MMPWKEALPLHAQLGNGLNVLNAQGEFVARFYSTDAAAAFVALANASSPPSPDAAGLAKECDDHARADWDTLANENTAIARGLLKHAARSLADREEVLRWIEQNDRCWVSYTTETERIIERGVDRAMGNSVLMYGEAGWRAAQLLARIDATKGKAE